jgi:phosphoserine aminotransferase
VHYTSNETIEGVEFKYDLDGKGVPVVCDASSNILSKPIDVEKYALIYAGAQKNIGPSGVTLAIIRDDLIAQVPENQHSMLDYRLIRGKRFDAQHAEHLGNLHYQSGLRTHQKTRRTRRNGKEKRRKSANSLQRY